MKEIRLNQLGEFNQFLEVGVFGWLHNNGTGTSRTKLKNFS
jgi:hypothetical protein